MPGIGLLIDGAMQQAPHSGRQGNAEGFGAKADTMTVSLMFNHATSRQFDN
jgi:hypothetical protein